MGWRRKISYRFLISLWPGWLSVALCFVGVPTFECGEGTWLNGLLLFSLSLNRYWNIWYFYLLFFILFFAASSKYGPKVPVSLLFPGSTFCKSNNIFMLVATIHLTAKKVKSASFLKYNCLCRGCLSFDTLDLCLLLIANWIVKNKSTSTQHSSFCAQLYSTEGSSGSLEIVLNHHKMGCSAC